jgi:hypothetical protein
LSLHIKILHQKDAFLIFHIAVYICVQFCFILYH